MKKYRTLLAAVLLLAIFGCAPREEEDTPAAEDTSADNGAAAQEEKNGLQAVPAEELIWVFRARGNRQCENGGTTLEQSRNQLSAAGVEIQESRCGTRTDRMYASVCGGQTGDILLHLVRKTALDAALQQGYDPAGNIEYQQASCPAGGS
ncbi:hypothetical protein [Microbulbifer yueqingensis]|uniref:Lipoprotein n=1 Tax=Microbulbifer yueqingensis TaxID=658219 RepID=A0A1G8UTB9_9GAMM|nr:hypothetical protein [Microbulbifer yueqingensis]SDJ57126.1 hypothetical protein SAMN05216212_0269 [Microbulbifer yueqingensis]